MLSQLCPLPEPLRGCACVRCDKAQAVWRLNKDETSICSLCVLYDPDVWSDGVAETITAVEISRGKMFLRDRNALLTECSDANHVVGVLVMVARASRVGAKRLS